MQTHTTDLKKNTNNNAVNCDVTMHHESIQNPYKCVTICIAEIVHQSVGKENELSQTSVVIP